MIKIADRLGHRGDILPGQDADHAREALGFARVEPDDISVRMRAAQDGGVAQPGHRLEIIDEARVAGQQSRILERAMLWPTHLLLTADTPLPAPPHSTSRGSVTI